MKNKDKLLLESYIQKIVEEDSDPFSFLPEIIKTFVGYAQKHMGFNKPLKVILKKDKNNSKELLGKTGLYDPNDSKVYLYVSGRHPKDILRTLSHELVHHKQNCEDRFNNIPISENGNVKDNDYIKELEKEAYETGNIVFREWEEKLKENEILDESNFMGSGAVVGYMAPLGMDMSPAHKIMHSGDEPLKKKKKTTNESFEAPKGLGKPLTVGDKEGLEKIHDEMNASEEQLPIAESVVPWEHNKSVSEKSGRKQLVLMYRALPATTSTIRTNDYITQSKKFAVEHAVTTAIYNDEPYQVVQTYLDSDYIVGAENNGEFKWTGPEKNAKPVYSIDSEGNVTKIRSLEEEYLGKKGGVRYFQMGGGIKDDKFYNKDMKTGKPTRDPGVPGLKK